MGLLSKLLGFVKPERQEPHQNSPVIISKPSNNDQDNTFYARLPEAEDDLLNDFTKIEPYPAEFSDLRINLRSKIREANKINNTELGKDATKKLYNLAILVTYLYGLHDGNSSVTGGEFDKAKPKVKIYGDKFKLDYQGRITDSKFLSDTDYKNIEKYWLPKEPVSFKSIKNLIFK